MSNYSPDEDDGPIMRARPRRTFEPSSTPNPASILNGQPLPPSSETRKSNDDGHTTPSRSRSILNLTSSTLFGIYQPTGYDINQDGTTPWGTGSQTPARTPVDGRRLDPLEISGAISTAKGRPSRPAQQQTRRRSTMTARQRRGFKGYVLPLVGRTVTLAVAGILYGMLISHLHDNQSIAPVEVDLDRSSRLYLAFWAVAGIVLGEALPRVDMLWASEHALELDESDKDQDRQTSRGVGAWNDVIRSVGAFVGVAFAIRKLPWQSTLQLSLTLAMANPAIWYLIDRSPPGFALSTVFALGGTAAVLGIYPDLIPSPTPSRQFRNRPLAQGGVNGTGVAVPSEELVLGVFGQESIGVATWIASVLFVSSVCFGNIGRRLAPMRP